MKKAKAKSAIETIKEAAWPRSPTMPASPFSTEHGTSPRVIPVLLNGDQATSLTPQLQNTVFIDFRKKQDYFGKLFDLVLTLHRIEFEHSGVVDLRRHLIMEAETTSARGMITVR